MTEFVSCPNLPTKKVKYVIVDYRCSEKIISSLKNLGITPFLSCRIDTLYDAVRGHSDMSIYHTGGNTFICEPTAYEYYKQTLTLDNINLIKGNVLLESTYPQDIAYNVARVSNYAFHNLRYTDNQILSYNSNIEFINVNQGYSKCNTCVIAENAIITEDESIYINAQKVGIDVLKIRPGNIKLEGLNYGFLGGVSGLIDKKVLAVTGNVEKHVDFDKIVQFCTRYGVKVYALTDETAVDIGSILPIAY